VWSAGCCVYALLTRRFDDSGPFRSSAKAGAAARELDGLFHAILECELSFEQIPSEGARSFVASLLQLRPRERCSAEDALRHEWIEPAVSSMPEHCFEGPRPSSKVASTATSSTASSTTSSTTSSASSSLASSALPSRQPSAKPMAKPPPGRAHEHGTLHARPRGPHIPSATAATAATRLQLALFPPIKGSLPSETPPLLGRVRNPSPNASPIASRTPSRSPSPKLTPPAAPAGTHARVTPLHGTPVHGSPARGSPRGSRTASPHHITPSAPPAGGVLARAGLRPPRAPPQPRLVGPPGAV